MPTFRRRRRTRGPNSKGPSIPKTSKYILARIGTPVPRWYAGLTVSKENGVTRATVHVRFADKDVLAAIPLHTDLGVQVAVQLSGGTFIRNAPSFLPATDSDDS